MCARGVRLPASLAVIATAMALSWACMAGQTPTARVPATQPAAAHPTGDLLVSRGAPAPADVPPRTRERGAQPSGEARSALDDAARADAAQQPFVLHLPGISGRLRVDQLLINGLKQGGLNANFEVYDWTCDDPGLDALVALGRNRQQATKIAQMIAKQFRMHPAVPIIVSAHSGGAGLAVWALEQLPKDVQVQTVLLLAPALSPGYDLTMALQHVRGKTYVFSSPYDSLVLGTGTRLFGTIDRVNTDAAGRVGFHQPPGADAAEYRKLVPMPYEQDWLKYNNGGDHIGVMRTSFARAVIAPLLMGTKAEAPAEQPAADGAHR